MAVKDVLLLLEPGEKGRPAAAAAIALARRAQAHITAVGVIVDLVPPTSIVSDFPYDAITQIMQRTLADTRAFYDGVIAASGVAADFKIVQGVPGEARLRFAQTARCHDLVVMRQPARGESADEELLAEAALFGSGRAVFMIPSSHVGDAKFESALIAWDGGLQASRALAAAVPLLRYAKRVEVVAAQDGGDEAAPGPSEVVRHLAKHGVKAIGRTLPAGRDAGAVLISYAAKFEADYLVMGAYGHSRMREVILGGVTRAVLKGMTTPVLMAH